MTNEPEGCRDNSRRLVLARRSLASILGLGAITALAGRTTSLQAARASDVRIPQPDTPGEAAFIQRAFEMRSSALEYGDQGYGAVVVRGGKIIGQSWSRVILDQDPTAHAEMAAIRDAAHRLNNRDLSRAVLYSSSRPCPMCEAAAYWAGIDKMVHGNAAADAGRPRLCR